MAAIVASCNAGGVMAWLACETIWRKRNGVAGVTAQRRYVNRRYAALANIRYAASSAKQTSAGVCAAPLWQKAAVTAAGRRISRQLIDDGGRVNWKMMNVDCGDVH